MVVVELRRTVQGDRLLGGNESGKDKQAGQRGAGCHAAKPSFHHDRVSILSLRWRGSGQPGSGKPVATTACGGAGPVMRDETTRPARRDAAVRTWTRSEPA